MTPIPPARIPPRRPYLDLPPGLGGGAGQHGGQVDAAHGTSRDLAEQDPSAAAAQDPCAGSRAWLYPGALANRERPRPPHSQSPCRRGTGGRLYLQPSPSWVGPGMRARPAQVSRAVTLAPGGGA